MAHLPLTYPMIQREAVRLASCYGLEPNYDNYSSFEITYDEWCKGALLHCLQYKGKRTTFTECNLYLSIDDFCELILHPFILSCVTKNDLKFIHMDYT